MDKRIREFKNDDIDRVMSIWLESTVEAHSFISKEYWEENYQVVKNKYIPMSETYVYEYDNDIKGFISVIEGSFIGALFVDIKAQGKGIGKVLVDYVKEKYEKLSLAVYSDNTKAYKFYKRQGFEEILEQNNEDSGYKEIVMEYYIGE